MKRPDEVLSLDKMMFMVETEYQRSLRKHNIIEYGPTTDKKVQLMVRSLAKVLIREINRIERDRKYPFLLPL